MLKVENLSISFPIRGAKNRNTVIQGLDFEVRSGECVGIVGESGSGKTMVGRAILNLLPPGGHIDEGRILFYDDDISQMPAAQLRVVRGRRIGMVFQEPMVSLNPSLTIGRQMTEGLMLHMRCDRSAANQQALEMLDRVQIKDPRRALREYPHSFSGGMRQRIILASVLMLKPDLLIADEPTTALDAIIQREVLDLMLDLVRDSGTGLILVSHDLPVVAQYAERMVVMRKGRIMETGAVSSIVTAPTRSYTQALLDALPVPGPERTIDRNVKPVIEAKDVKVEFAGRKEWPWSKPNNNVAVDEVSFAVYPGEIVGLVGESGSGKTTIGRALLDLVAMREGAIERDGVSGPLGDQSFRRDMQIVFQDPYSSINPRMTVRQIVAEGMRLLPSLTLQAKTHRLREVLDAVQMPLAEFGDRLPHELSGGQRQRVCIARTIVTRPRFLVADEAVSALDLTVQREILVLLKALQEDLGFSALFISHDIAVIEEIADRVIVMYRGRLVEAASKKDFFSNPTHPYSRRLLTAVPQLVKDDNQQRRVVTRDLPPLPAPSGHSFADSDAPRHSIVYREIAPGHQIALSASETNAMNA